MKTYLTRTVLFAASVCAAAHGFSQTTENFNSRNNIPVNLVKGYLQGNCWQLPGFVTSASAAMEGDGSLVSDTSAQPVQPAGIYTPALDLKGATTISFTYSPRKEAAYSSWIKLYVVNAANQVVKALDSIEIKNSPANNIYLYNRSVEALSGVYRILIEYTDAGRAAPIAVDQLQISAVQHYAIGCNLAPVAVSDAFSGGATGTSVNGNVMLNDRDPDGDQMSAYLISGSADGTVSLAPNGYFTFVPRPGFNGSAASFTYKVCDNGYSPLCSNTATAMLLFTPGNIVPLKYIDFNAAYKNNEVLLNWTTAYENSTESFDIERSSDSLYFTKLAAMRGYGTLGSINFYKYSDAQSPATDALKVLYYRLKSVDSDKKIVYSPVIKVKIEGISGLKSMKVTPNPVISDMALNLQLNRTCGVTVKVMNSTGTVVYNQEVQAEAGTNHITLQGTARLQNGLYFVQVLIDKNEKLMSKIIKE